MFGGTVAYLKLFELSFESVKGFNRFIVVDHIADHGDKRIVLNS